MAKRGGKETAEGDKRRIILRAAISVFARQGYHGCRIADVAREAGVAYGLVYHYFENKDVLLASVFEQIFDDFLAGMNARLEARATLPEQLHALTRYALQTCVDDPEAMRVIIFQIARGQAASRSTRESAFGRMIGICGGLLEAARARGELRSELDLALLAAQLYGVVEMGMTALVMGVAGEATEGGKVDAAARQLASSFLRGVLNDPARAEEKKEAAWSGTSDTSETEARPG